MDERVYFADVELPFHVWVREDTGAGGYRWVLREAPPPQAAPDASDRSYADRPQDESK
jgi:hypothetical protein